MATPERKRSRRAAALVTSALLGGAIASTARAAGGHFDVDDAAILDPGRCQVESWATRATSIGSTLLHVGPGCRVGAVEASLNVDRLPGDDSAALGPQLKWATHSDDGRFAAGAVAVATRDPHDHRWATTFYVPATIVPVAPLALNLNAGIDRRASGGTSGRFGASIEWQALKTWTLLAERIRFSGATTSRIGARWSLARSVSVDGSVARLGPYASKAATLGLNVEFGRP